MGIEYKSPPPADQLTLVQFVVILQMHVSHTVHTWLQDPASSSAPPPIVDPSFWVQSMEEDPVIVLLLLVSIPMCCYADVLLGAFTREDPSSAASATQ